jgi:type II secretory pathway pseudopilin PulG
MATKSHKPERASKTQKLSMTQTARKTETIARTSERGYALVALLAMMTLMLILMMAAAPSVQQQSRRERELETIARGEEVAEAIRMFIHYANRPPTSIEELQEGAPFGTKKVQVLRASAAHDLLSESGEWRLIKVNDSAFVSFVRDLTKYADGRLPNATTDTHPMMQQIAGTLPRITNILDTGNSEDAPGGGDNSSLTSNGPFIGVASRSRRESIVAYYGIERHDEWVFTPFFK